MFKRRDKVGITRGRVQRLFQLLHQSSHKDFYDQNRRKRNVKKKRETKHETSL